jgi:tRNA A-37 threonylcarbamoyl transferase component Bud32
MAFNNTINTFKINNPEWIIVDRIGKEGKDGLAFILNHKLKTGLEAVVKFFKDKKSLKMIKREFNFLEKCSNIGISPKLFQDNIDGKRYIIMDRLEATLKEYIKEKKSLELQDIKKIIFLYKELGELGIWHNDSNILRNIMIKGDRFYLIDFGMANKINLKDKKKYGPNPNFMLLSKIFKFIKNKNVKAYLRKFIDDYEFKYNVCIDLQYKMERVRQIRLEMLLNRSKKK